ncbi:Na+/H+ antiporter NhaC family protein [Treponema medium]|uniref:Na+/H+ antiporter NhaC family protein n=1 Tax=Treponema medium TaxID=58231 RepID=UPI001981655D|nr:Na+/H+ antiporter NhaC family protein [Treponema medium]QSH91703.1 Na+/H+ antiporter NhaC family protein [Treponema medium]
MDHFGIWGIIPPVLTIALAFITKDVIVSLFLGILSGCLIVAGGNPAAALMKVTDLLAGSLADGWNIRIFLFCGLLGALVGMLSKTGAAQAFGLWMSKKLKNKTASQFATFIFGLIVFIDDYFNSLTVGTVMRPINDQHKVPRAKLAYILDSTAAPVCILAPVSSWVVTVMSIVRNSEGFSKLGMSDFEFFIRAIPYNLYALTTILMILVIIFFKSDFGAMKKSEDLARTSGLLWNEELYGVISGDIPEEQTTRAKPIDMLLPILLLIVFAIAFFPAVSWINTIDGFTITTISQAAASMSLRDAFINTDSSYALFYAIIFTLTVTYIYYLARRLMNLKEASEAVRDGIKSMVPALIILTMAWSIGAVIRSSPADGGLGLGRYLSELVVSSSFPLWILPAIVFALSAVIAFATGTSWGTFGIMIPIIMPIAVGLTENAGLVQNAAFNAVFICISAVLGGAVFGDHASPISDTTILSSTGAACPHLEHVATQMPYALFVATCSLAGFITGGIFMNILSAWIAVLVVFTGGIIILPKITKVHFQPSK